MVRPAVALTVLASLRIEAALDRHGPPVYVRKEAVRAVAGKADLVLVVGSANSSNSRRLVEVAERAGSTAHLIDDATDLNPRWLASATTVTLTAGASSPERLVQDLLRTLAALGPISVHDQTVTEETITFSLPKEVQ